MRHFDNTYLERLSFSTGITTFSFRSFWDCFTSLKTTGGNSSWRKSWIVSGKMRSNNMAAIKISWTFLNIFRRCLTAKLQRREYFAPRAAFQRVEKVLYPHLFDQVCHYQSLGVSKLLRQRWLLRKGVEATVRYSDINDLFEDDECNNVQEPLIEE